MTLARIFALGASVALALAGCRHQITASDLQPQVDEAKASCKAAQTTGEIPPSHVAYEQCASPKAMAILTQGRMADLDLVELYYARRMAIADRWDRGELSDAQAEAEMAAARAAMRITATERQRADKANTAAILGAYMATRPPAPAPYQLPMPAPLPAPNPGFTCQRLGDFTHCQ
jgi:hypothetical protein